VRLKFSKVSRYQSNRWLDHIVAGVPARTAADLVGVNRPSGILSYHRLRAIIVWRLEQEWAFSGAIEIDESYFGGRRKGRRGRGTTGKIPVFGILQRGGKVYTKVIPDANAQIFLPIIRNHAVPDSIVYTDYFRSYNVLDVLEFKHFRINHRETFVERQAHINGIENFWNQVNRHLWKYNGIPKSHFPLFLKECEWRFNYGSPQQFKRDLETLGEILFSIVISYASPFSIV